ncbi:hypothetical protein WA158_006234 [Blastocystis sp. Blastoise]
MNNNHLCAVSVKDTNIFKCKGNDILKIHNTKLYVKTKPNCITMFNKETFEVEKSKSNDHVQIVCWNVNDLCIITSYSDGILEIWDHDMNLLKQLTGHDIPATSCCISLDGSKMISLCDKYFVLWNTCDWTLSTSESVKYVGTDVIAIPEGFAISTKNALVYLINFDGKSISDPIRSTVPCCLTDIPLVLPYTINNKKIIKEPYDTINDLISNDLPPIRGSLPMKYDNNLDIHIQFMKYISKTKIIMLSALGQIELLDINKKERFLVGEDNTVINITKFGKYEILCFKNNDIIFYDNQIKMFSIVFTEDDIVLSMDTDEHYLYYILQNGHLKKTEIRAYDDYCKGKFIIRGSTSYHIPYINQTILKEEDENDDEDEDNIFNNNKEIINDNKQIINNNIQITNNNKQIIDNNKQITNNNTSIPSSAIHSSIKSKPTIMNNNNSLIEFPDDIPPPPPLSQLSSKNISISISNPSIPSISSKNKHGIISKKPFIPPSSVQAYSTFIENHNQEKQQQMNQSSSIKHHTIDKQHKMKDSSLINQDSISKSISISTHTQNNTSYEQKRYLETVNNKEIEQKLYSSKQNTSNSKQYNNERIISITSNHEKKEKHKENEKIMNSLNQELIHYQQLIANLSNNNEKLVEENNHLKKEVLLLSEKNKETKFSPENNNSSVTPLKNDKSINKKDSKEVYEKQINIINYNLSRITEEKELIESQLLRLLSTYSPSQITSKQNIPLQISQLFDYYIQQINQLNEQNKQLKSRKSHHS